MKVNVKESSKTTRTLEIEIEDERVLKEIEKGFQAAAKAASEPGFRKGKVPRSIIEKKYRASVEQDVVERLVPEALVDAFKEHDLKVLGQPRLSGIGGTVPPLKFTAEVDIKPEVKLKGVEGIKLTAPSTKVEEKEIDEQVEGLRKRGATVGEAVDRAAAMGDHVEIDFLGKLKGEPFEGGKAENYAMVLGEGNLIPGFEDGIKGMKAGDEKTLKLTFPKDYQAENLKGQKTEFDIKLHVVKERVLPEANDEFAATLGDFKTMDEIREKIKEGLQDQKDQNRKTQLSVQAEEALAKAHKFDAPATLVDSELRVLLDRQAYAMRQQGMEFKPDDASRKELEEKNRPVAEQRARLRLILDKIAEENSIEIGHEDLHKEIHRLAPGMGLSAEQAVEWFHQNNREDTLKAQLREQKALEWVVEKAKIKE